MKTLLDGKGVLGLCSALIALGLNASLAQSAAPTTILAQVTFANVDFIRTGELANYTDVDQRISFKVFTSQVVDVTTGNTLTTGPDAFFAVRNFAIKSDDKAHSTQYCLDMIRSVAMNPTAGAQLTLYLNVTQESPGGPNFIVHTFQSCHLQLPSP